MRTRVCAFLLALAVSAAPAFAVTTAKYALTNSGWTDLGAGPLLLSFQGSGVFAVGDTTPTLTSEGFGIRAGRSFPVKTTSHVWAATTGAFGVNAYAAPITGSGGGGSTCAQATAYLARTTGGNEGGNAANITTLICGLVTDGVWPNLDALYVLAQQNQADAQLNLIGTSYGLTSVGLLRSVSFTSYVGFSGFANAVYLNTGFNPSTAPSPKFVQNSGNIGVWSYSSTGPHIDGLEMGTSTSAAGLSNIIVSYSDGNFYARVNGAGAPGIVNPGTKGLYVGDRSSSANIVPYWGGAAQAAQTNASASPFNGVFTVGNVGATSPTNQTLCEAHIGASLGAAGNLALYNRLRAYMTAVGVP